MIAGEVPAGRSLYEALLVHDGVLPATVEAILRAAADLRDLSRVRAGETYRFAFDAEGRLLEYRQRETPFEELVVQRGADGELTARIEKAEVERIRRRASGRVEGSLWDAAIASAIEPEIVIGLTDIFAWQIDFLTETRSDDAFDVLWDDLRIDGEKVGEGPVLAARYVNRRTVHEAVRYETEDGRSDYFDPSGRSRRLQFLRSPLSYRRISSGFSRARMHPILRRVTPHHGIDFAADRGTPVVASGDGKVLFAGRKGPNGNMVEIGHGSIYRSYYLHLARFARGVKRGAPVSQGQTIGYVGSTGRSTGPHLDYRMKRHDTYVDPLKETFREVRAVPGEELTRFQEVCRKLLAELDAVDAASTFASNAGAERD